jgi:hypothetical protein
MKEFTESEPLVDWLVTEHEDIIQDVGEKYIVLRWSTKRIDIWEDLKFQLSGSVVTQRGCAEKVTAGEIEEMIDELDGIEGYIPEETLLRFHTDSGEYGLSFL